MRHTVDDRSYWILMARVRVLGFVYLVVASCGELHRASLCSGERVAEWLATLIAAGEMVSSTHIAPAPQLLSEA